MGIWGDSVPAHTLRACVNTQRSVMPVSSVGVTISAPRWPYMFPFPFFWLVGWWVGRWVCVSVFGKYGIKWALDVIAGRQLTHKPPQVCGGSAAWRNGSEAERSALHFTLVCFSKCKVSSLHSFWQSKKWDWLCSFKFLFLPLVMTIHTEQRCSVSVLDELTALGLEYGFQDLPEAVSPEGCVLSLFIAPFLVWPYCNFWTARFRYCSSLQQ